MRLTRHEIAMQFFIFMSIPIASTFYVFAIESVAKLQITREVVASKPALHMVKKVFNREPMTFSDKRNKPCRTKTR